jgi:hypothetical protein
MLLWNESAWRRRDRFTPHNAAIYGLEPVKKLENAALMTDFSLGKDVRAAAIPAAGPNNTGQSKKTLNPLGESKKNRLAALPAQLQPAAGMRPRVRLAIRPFLLSRDVF